MSAIYRRRFLSYAAALPLALYLPVSLGAGRLPGKIHALEGEVFINQRAANMNSSIQAGDRLSVAYGGRLVFGMGEDTYLLQEGSSLELVSRDNKIISGLRLLTAAYCQYLENAINLLQSIPAPPPSAFAGRACI